MQIRRSLHSLAAVVILFLAGCQTTSDEDAAAERTPLEKARMNAEAAPNDPEAQYAYANALFDEGRLGEAIRAYEGTVALDSEKADALTNMGLAYKRLGLLNDALSAYRRSLAIAPEDTVTLQNYAIALSEAGAIPELELAMAQLTRVNPADPLLWTEYGNVLLAVGKPETASMAYETAIRLQPDDGNLHYLLGVAQSEQGNANGALASWTRAVGLDSQLGVAYAALARAYARQTDYDRAWSAVAECERLGYSLSPEFMSALREKSGRLSHSAPR